MNPLNRSAMLHERMTNYASGIAVQAMVLRPMLLAVTFAMIAVPAICRSQTQEPGLGSTIEAARADMRADRNTIICAAMNFSDKDAAAFWPIYRKYEYERSILDDGRAVVIKEYSEKYLSLTDADAKAMAERMLDYDSRDIALKRKYLKEFDKVLPATTVAKFFQLDHRIDLLMAMKVEAVLPPLAGAQNSEQPK